MRWESKKKKKKPQILQICPFIHEDGITDPDKASCKFNRKQYFSQEHAAAIKCHNNSFLWVTIAFLFTEKPHSEIIDDRSFFNSKNIYFVPFKSRYHARWQRYTLYLPSNGLDSRRISTGYISLLEFFSCWKQNKSNSFKWLRCRFNTSNLQ